MSSLATFWDQLHDVPALGKRFFFEENALDMDMQFWLTIEDEWASKYADFVWRIIANRCRRKAYMYGYPHRFIWLKGDAPRYQKENEIKLFKNRYEVHEEFLTRPATGVAPRHKLRSQFNCVDVKQFVEGCSLSQWQYTQENWGCC